MRLLYSSVLLVFTAIGHAPAAPPDSLRPRPWYVPHHAIGQFAGGQGVAALGAGYTTGRLDLDVLAGYVPARYSITPMGIFHGQSYFLAVGNWTWALRAGSCGPCPRAVW